MSTGNNQTETIVSKKRKRKVAGYIHPNKPEIKKFDFFDGGAANSGQYHMHNSREILTTYDPHNAASDQTGCWQIINMVNPVQGVASNNRVGMKYFLKYMKFKGHISLSPKLPFTIHYKLLLVKSDRTYSTRDEFFATNYCNYEPLQSTAFSNNSNTSTIFSHSFHPFISLIKIMTAETFYIRKCSRL